METNPFSETLFCSYLAFRTLDNSINPVILAAVMALNPLERILFHIYTLSVSHSKLLSAVSTPAADVSRPTKHFFSNQNYSDSIS
jgi:hypothetical protein